MFPLPFLRENRSFLFPWSQTLSYNFDQPRARESDVSHFRTEVLRTGSRFAIVSFPFAVLMGDVPITAS